MLNEIYTEFNKLNEIGKLYIAGGAVRDELLNITPKDFDLFVLDNVENKEEKISEYLKDYEEVDPIVPWHQSEPHLIKNVKYKDYIIQVMNVTIDNLDDLLDTFDWNICMFAYDRDFYQKCNTEDIGVGKDLILNKITYPLSTLRRGFRFSERFKMKFKVEDIKELCRIINEKKESLDERLNG